MAAGAPEDQTQARVVGRLVPRRLPDEVWTLVFGGSDAWMALAVDTVSALRATCRTFRRIVDDLLMKQFTSERNITEGVYEIRSTFVRGFVFVDAADVLGLTARLGVRVSLPIVPCFKTPADLRDLIRIRLAAPSLVGFRFASATLAGPDVRLPGLDDMVRLWTHASRSLGCLSFVGIDFTSLPEPFGSRYVCHLGCIRLLELTDCIVDATCLPHCTTLRLHNVAIVGEVGREPKSFHYHTRDTAVLQISGRLGFSSVPLARRFFRSFGGLRGLDLAHVDFRTVTERQPRAAPPAARAYQAFSFVDTEGFLEALLLIRRRLVRSLMVMRPQAMLLGWDVVAANFAGLVSLTVCDVAATTRSLGNLLRRLPSLQCLRLQDSTLAAAGGGTGTGDDDDDDVVPPRRTQGRALVSLELRRCSVSFPSVGWGSLEPFGQMVCEDCVFVSPVVMPPFASCAQFYVRPGALLSFRRLPYGSALARLLINVMFAQPPFRPVVPVYAVPLVPYLGLRILAPARFRLVRRRALGSARCVRDLVVVAATVPLDLSTLFTNRPDTLGTLFAPRWRLVICGPPDLFLNVAALHPAPVWLPTPPSWPRASPGGPAS
jgi:hypothetical protein